MSKIWGEGEGQHDQHFVKNKFVKNRVGGSVVNLNLDDVFKYTVFFWILPLSHETNSAWYGSSDICQMASLKIF